MLSVALTNLCSTSFLVASSILAGELILSSCSDLERALEVKEVAGSSPAPLSMRYETFFSIKSGQSKTIIRTLQ